MKYHSLFLTLSVLALAGCSSTPRRVDAVSIDARTFSFVNLGAKPAPNYADNRQAVHAAIPLV